MVLGVANYYKLKVRILQNAVTTSDFTAFNIVILRTSGYHPKGLFRVKHTLSVPRNWHSTKPLEYSTPTVCNQPGYNTLGSTCVKGYVRLPCIIIASLVAVLPGCSDDAFDINDFRDDSSIATLNGTWMVISFEHFRDRRVEFRTKENSWNGYICVSFDDNADPKQFSGGIITNSVFGEFDYLGARHFKLRRLGTTFVGEPEWGDKFRGAICGNKVPYKISAQRLRIYFDNNRQSVTLERQPSRILRQSLQPGERSMPIP
jgi:hypothetical protein